MRKTWKAPAKSQSGEDTGGEQDDLKKDLSFLKSSPLPDRGRLRSTQEKPMNERQKALEALKKKRAGTDAPTSSATPSRRRTVIVESESESELDIIEEETKVESESSDLDDIEDEEDNVYHANAQDIFRTLSRYTFGLIC